MAKRKNEDAADKGFQIPIEDANGKVENAAEEAVQDEVAPVGETLGSEPVGASSSSPAGEAGQAVDTEAPAGDADELIAEAEAVVEEAAETLSAEEQLAKAQADVQKWQDRYMRLHAEWDTYRRRTQEQRAEEKARATEKLMENLLPVLDDFERTVAYADENGETGLLDGVKAVQSKLADALVKGGLEVIDPAGQPYDALEAQAVATVSDDEAFDETVKDVYQKGYKMGKKVLRPAMVTVTTGGPKRPKEEPEEDL